MSTPAERKAPVEEGKKLSAAQWEQRFTELELELKKAQGAATEAMEACEAAESERDALKGRLTELEAAALRPAVEGDGAEGARVPPGKDPGMEIARLSEALDRSKAIITQLEGRLASAGAMEAWHGELVPLSKARPVSETDIHGNVAENQDRLIFFCAGPVYEYEEVRTFVTESGWGDFVRERLMKMAELAFSETLRGAKWELMPEFRQGAKLQLIARVLPAPAKAPATGALGPAG